MYRRRQRSKLAALLFVALVAATAPAAADHEPLVDVSLGQQYTQNFNDGPGNWTAVTPPTPPTTSFAHGVPTSGPGVAFSGTNVFATNLTGNYRNNDCGAILSPPINLSGASAASASFMQWRHIEEGSTTAFDGGLLFVTADDGATYTKVTPAGGYTSKALGTTARACLKSQPTGTLGLSGPTGTTPPPPVYSPVTTDLTAFAGQTIRFAIAFASDGVVSRAGWYIDDFAVTVNGVTTVTDFESGPAGFSIQSWGTPKAPNGWSHGTPTNGPAGTTAADPPMWATNLTGNYGFNECSSIESPPMTLGVAGQVTPATKAVLSWRQWFKASSGAAGVVQIGENGTYTNVKPKTGYPTGASTALDPCLGNVAQQTGAFNGTMNAVGSAMTDYAADLTPWLGKTITLRYLFASTETAILAEGWYVDDVAIELREYVGAPHLPDTGKNAPGWTSGGTSSTWAWGSATAGPAGEVTYGTNLEGDYNHNECSFIESPAVPGPALAANPQLTFSHWYEIESLSATGSAWDGGVILASGDNGTTWSYVNSSAYTKAPFSTALKNCLTAAGVATTNKVFTGDKKTWDTINVDLSAFATSPTVKVRFLFGSDGSVKYDGWYIKSVSIGGVPVLP